MNNYKIIISDSIDDKFSRILIEIAGLLGFYSTSKEFSIIILEKDKNVDLEYMYVKKSIENKIKITGNNLDISLVENEEEQFNFFPTIVKTIKQIFESKNNENTFQGKTLPFSIEGLNKLKNEKKIEILDNRNTRGVESLFSTGFLNSDKNNDLLPDSLDLKFYIEEKMSLENLIAISNMAARFTMDVTEYKFPITTDNLQIKENILIVENTFVTNENLGLEIKNEKVTNRKTVYLRETKEKIVEFSKYICENLFNLNSLFNLEDITLNLINKLEINDEKTDIQENIIIQKEYNIPWEVDVYKNIVFEEILPTLKKGDQIIIDSSLSESSEIREKIKEEIKTFFLDKGIEKFEIELFSTYKQGYSWIDEKIIPTLLTLGKEKIGKIDIFFKAFLPQGEKEWKDENGAVPSYNIASDNNPNKWFDLPIRNLQELYPIDDTISEKIGINRNYIEFKELDGSKNFTYEIIVYSHKGEELLKKDYTINHSQRPYIDEFKDLGLVHPTTGHIKVYVNNEKILDKNIKTDLENIWDIYQKDTLPMCKEVVLNKIKNNVSKEKQPLFSKLQIDIEVSEPNFKLNSREDLISSVDSFHEDIYFVGADYFKILGEREFGENFDSPGLIYPVIKNVESKPKMRFRLYGLEEKKLKGADLIKDIFVKKISMIDGTLNILYSINNVGNCKLEEENIRKRLEKLKKEIELLKQNNVNIQIQIEGFSNLTVNIPKSIEIKRKKLITEIDICETKIIGYDEYIRIIEELKEVEGVKVNDIARSYQGRKIYSIEFIPQYRGYISKNKLINSRPVYMINSRHHANEVSGTNSSFMLIKELLTNKKYKDFSKKINLVIIPFENVDGGAIHYELQKDNPNWIFHTARFNSLGKEFTNEYHKENTIHTEAKGFTDVWRKWLPDIITDNHGVPKHEWAQQFSGYTSPSFKGFWLPRSLIYGYFWWLNDKEFLGNTILSKKLEKVVADSINAHENISKINEDWRDRFKKYANAWMPKLFPADYFENIIMYWIPFKQDTNHKYTNIKYPWITSILFTSEVADETAQGEYLKLCGKTHFYHNIATIDMMMQCKLHYDRDIIYNEKELVIKNTRLRPII